MYSLYMFLRRLPVLKTGRIMVELKDMGHDYKVETTATIYQMYKTIAQICVCFIKEYQYTNIIFKNNV